MVPPIAHQGGWDEALLFVVPIAIAYLVIKVLERHGRREPGDHGNGTPEDLSPHRDSGSQNNIP